MKLPVRRVGAQWIARRLPVAVAGFLLTASATLRLAAQDSQFGILGLGTPGRAESVRARSTGGAFAAFDPLTPLVDAALAELPQLSAGAVLAATYRRVEVDTSTTTLRTSRFPAVTVAGPVFRGQGRPGWVVGGGFATYLDRSYSVITEGTMDLRGTPQAFRDQITSDGGVSDLRLALATRPTRDLAVGAALHLLSGTTRVTVIRDFRDSTYADVGQQADVLYSGLGGSASLIARLGPTLRVAGWLRSDRALRASVQEVETARHDLPVEIGGALGWQPSPTARFAASVARRSWSRAGANAFDTFSWAVGAELGRPALPLRLGVRSAQLPFGSGATAPTERGLAAGTGRAFSDGRAIVDLGVERLDRRSGAERERVWTVLVGITVRP
ncbi:MAG: hypothetical protein ACREL9_12675 [Gemmatimonadales bacterium]